MGAFFSSERLNDSIKRYMTASRLKLISRTAAQLLINGKTKDGALITKQNKSDQDILVDFKRNELTSKLIDLVE